MKYIFILVFIISSSCVATRNQVYNSPYLSEACANKFPVKDSIGETITVYRPAENTNYKDQIDSLNLAIHDLNRQMVSDKEKIDDTGHCCVIARQYTLAIGALLKQNDKLKQSYVPCKPDTIDNSTTIFKRNPAEESRLKDLVWLEHEKYSRSNAEAILYKRIAIVSSSLCLLIAGFGIFILAKGRPFSFLTSLSKSKA